MWVASLVGNFTARPPTGLWNSSPAINRPQHVHFPTDWHAPATFYTLAQTEVWPLDVRVLKHCHLQYMDSLIFFFFCYCWQPQSNKAERFDYVSKSFSFYGLFQFYLISLFYLITHKNVTVMLQQIMEFLKRMAGAEYVGFSNATWVWCEANTTLLSFVKYNLIKGLLCVSVSSQRRRPATGIMQLVITSKRKR